jgi:DNA ligase (NAD+)
MEIVKGKKFLVTGGTGFLGKNLVKYVTDNGGEVKSSVGKDLNYLVIADPNSASSKAVAARKQGVTLISEEDFLAMVN